MKKVQFVIVIVVYKNVEDIVDLIFSINKFDLDIGIIVVNSFYDDKSMNECKIIADKYSCEFINIPNKGYGFGNNRGIEYANTIFNYDYLIVSNADIVIKKFDTINIEKYKSSIIGPVILTANNKSQNPFWVMKNSIAEWLIYKGFVQNQSILRYTGIIINKIIRELFLIIFKIKNKRFSKIFALHGSFIIFSNEVLKEIGLPYDEDMFLFFEEAHLAHYLADKKISSYITKDIEVLHKEDGSINVSNIDEKSEARKSVMTYYEKLKNKKEG